MKCETFTTVDGGGPSLVLIHGVGLDHTMWDGVVDRLASTHLVIRYDLLGHGLTPDPAGPRTLDDFVVQLLSVLDTYQLDQANIAGLSLGGMVAMAAAARHGDRFDHLALLNTVFERSPEEVASVGRRLAMAENEGMAAVADLAVDRWFPLSWQAEHPGEVARVRQRLSNTDFEAYLKAYRVFVEGDPLMPHGASLVTVPTLAMTGELDAGSTPLMSQALASAIPGGRLLILPGLHHLPPIEAPDNFVGALMNFLDREAAS